MKYTPLYFLLIKHQKLEQGLKQQAAFCLAKDTILSNILLMHYDPRKPLVPAVPADHITVAVESLCYPPKRSQKL